MSALEGNISFTVSDREGIEARIRAAFEGGDKRAAATILLESYGKEIFGFLVSRLRDRHVASEAFSRFTEDLWRGLDGFRWHCPARVWAYTLAQHAASHTLRDQRRRRQVPLSSAGPLSEIADRIRTATVRAARTETRNRILELRERLAPEDQTLLILRVNRRLGWTDIAHVMFHEGELVDPAVLDKEAARLRKRFQAVKEKLRQMATEEGLVTDDD